MEYLCIVVVRWFVGELLLVSLCRMADRSDRMKGAK
jgi:hypothetical protein